MTAPDPALLEGRTAVITGATSGVGQAAALELARRGARILFVARDPVRSTALLERLRTLSSARHEAVIADLSLVAETARAGAEIAARTSAVDLLLNNAGAVFDRREETAEGLERTFALNHIAYFVLTNALRARLQASPGARVISTGSHSHRHASFDPEDLQNRSRAGFANAYARSKLYNLLWTRECARRWPEGGTTFNCFHPGVVATRIGSSLTSPVLRAMFQVQQVFARSAEVGATCALYLATSPAVAGKSGGYWAAQRPSAPSREALSEEAGIRLWDASEALAQPLLGAKGSG